MITKVGDEIERGSSLTEGEALAADIREVWSGDPWHGPALAGLLDGVSPERAATRPEHGGHSLWELVLHVTAWAETCRTRLEGRQQAEPEAGDFPPVLATTAQAWTEARSRLERAHESLAARVARLTSAELNANVPGCDYDARFLVRGAVCHTVYHSGQIALLSRHGRPAGRQGSEDRQ